MMFLMALKINIADVPLKEDPCGALGEMYSSDNLGFAFVIAKGKATPHIHKKMEEVYFIIKGEGELVIGEETLQIKPGDLIPIPKNVIHYLLPTGEPLEVLVTTHPKYIPSDFIIPSGKERQL